MEGKKMFEDMPSEEEVARNLFSFSGDIYGPSDTKRFLEIASEGKVMSCRLITWLSAMRVIDGERVKWMPDLMRALTYYDRCVKRYFKTTYYNPLENVNDGPRIRAGIETNMKWFNEMAKYEEYKDTITADAELRFGRMIATSVIDNEKMKYQEGDEKIFMISYLVALGFARRGTLTNYVAEAFAFHISNVIILALDGQRQIISLRVDDDFTADFLHLMKRFAPESIKKCKLAGVDPCAIQRAYISTFFTNGFETESMLILMDSLILNIKPHSYRSFTNYLTVALFRQTELRGGRFETEEIIPDHPWAAIDLIDDVYAMQHTKEINFMKMLIDVSCPCINGFNALFGHKF